MHTDQRLAVAAAVGLFVTMLLPWYTETAISVKGTSVPRTANGSFSAFGAFSFVEAAVLLVSVFVICVVFARAEERAFHLPGGDGTVIMLAGGWAAILIFYRMLDKPGVHTSGVLYTEGITWGIFAALFVAIALSYSGWRMRVAARPEPPLVMPSSRRRPRAPAPDAEPPASDSPSEPETEPETEPTPAGDAPRPRYPTPPADRDDSRPPPRRGVTREDAAQLSFDDPPTSEPFADDPPVARRPR